jgi:2-polyprenyl-3-methyl-5-hydroxy-6-metoxy-1,4-benzoquinol methylase
MDRVDMPLLTPRLTQARLSRVKPFVGKKILDVGCGHGELLDFLPPTTESVVFLDRNKERLPKIRQRLAKSAIQGEFLLGEVDKQVIHLPQESFDTVVMAALIEHLKSPEWALKQVHQLLKPGGRLIITTPTPLGGRLHRIGSFFFLTHREAADEHERFLPLRSLKTLMDRNGFVIERYERFLFGLNQLLVARKQPSPQP